MYFVWCWVRGNTDASDNNMKKEFKLAALIFIGFISFLWLEKPLRELLSIFQIAELEAKYYAGFMVRVILIFAALGLVKKLKFRSFTGLESPGKYTNIQAIFIPLSFILAGLFSNWDNYNGAQLHILILFAGNVLAVGIVEELFFRGTIFPLCIKAFKDSQRPILFGAMLSGSLFGIVHFINLFSQPDNLIGITVLFP